MNILLDMIRSPRVWTGLGHPDHMVFSHVKKEWREETMISEEIIKRVKGILW